VFTPFWRRAYEFLAAGGFQERLLAAPRAVGAALRPDPGAVDRLELLGPVDWHSKLERHWRPGESAALDRWAAFFEADIADYDADRERPDIPGTSMLSPALHFGEISALRLYAQCAGRLADEPDEGARAGIIRFMMELGWREFARHVLHAWPDLPNRSLDRRFDRPEAWESDVDGRMLRAWRQGETGFSLIDAGMRQLWETGWMHNRVRMVVASFLTKNLGIHWREGAHWFWDTLVDADLASNTLGWQWVAGCGTDAAPYYRIFNPETQAQKFDPDHTYRAHWLGEGLRPTPVLDLKASRARALARYQHAIKNRAA
jgi:deoxyribodipyrimidine photo-lyase